MKCCPTCNRPLASDNPFVGKRQHALYELLTRRPAGATREELMGWVYKDDVDGGRDNMGIISVMVSQMNDKLKGFNIPLRIRGSGGPGSVFKLVAADTPTIHGRLSPGAKETIAASPHSARELASQHGVSTQTIHVIRKQFACR